MKASLPAPAADALMVERCLRSCLVPRGAQVLPDLLEKADTERTRLARRFRAVANGAQPIFAFDLTRVCGTPRVLLARGRRDAARRSEIPGATRKPSSGVMRVPQDSGTFGMLEVREVPRVGKVLRDGVDKRDDSE